MHSSQNRVTCWLHPDAERELSEAAMYYAEHASNKIADAFLVEFERVTTLLSQNQQIGTLARGGVRIHPFRRFPYCVVYSESASGPDPEIYAVAHQRREPQYWQNRL